MKKGEADGETKRRERYTPGEIVKTLQKVIILKGVVGMETRELLRKIGFECYCSQ